MVCVRVTRACNARCSFCLAPPDGHHPPTEALQRRIDWLFDHGMRVVHFCGGEPTLHRGLPELLAHARARGGKMRMTTNGIVMPDAVLDGLRASKARVKVSVHGDAAHHDHVVGRPAYDAVTTTIRRLVGRNVRTTVQTTVLASNLDGWESVLQLSLRLGAHGLTVMPFIPRGSGLDRSEQFALSDGQRRRARQRVREARRAHSGRLDVRWVDLVTKPFHVLEPDGRLVVEGRSESFDVELAQL
jgi:MoaA/NifB/PqqE/SkfB family radical SAM enzyme